MHPLYANIATVLASTPLYMPISLSLFMPVDSRKQRSRFLEKLQLLSPCAVIKYAVGGSTGTLSWAVRC